MKAARPRTKMPMAMRKMISFLEMCGLLVLEVVDLDEVVGDFLREDLEEEFFLVFVLAMYIQSNQKKRCGSNEVVWFSWEMD